MRRFGLAVLIGLALSGPAAADEPGWRFRWQPGQVLSYRVEQVTAVTEAVGGNKVETSVKVALTKRWQVLQVDEEGTATLKLTLAAMRHEQTGPDGKVLRFDSAHPDSGSPELRERLEKFIGQPLAVLRVDARGKVVEVKQGSPARYESDPPFVVVLPAAAPAVGQAWERAYKATPEPSQGSGGPYEAVQKYVCSKADPSAAVIRLSTQFRNPPQAAAEMAPLAQRLPEGEVVFGVESGRLQSARLRIDRTVQGHQGEGSSYHFRSSYTEQYVGDGR
jgi:hypothetical protein